MSDGDDLPSPMTTRRSMSKKCAAPGCSRRRQPGLTCGPQSVGENRHDDGGQGHMQSDVGYVSGQRGGVLEFQGVAHSPQQNAAPMPRSREESVWPATTCRGLPSLRLGLRVSVIVDTRAGGTRLVSVSPRLQRSAAIGPRKQCRCGSFVTSW
jgi:hypothetical protein